MGGLAESREFQAGPFPRHWQEIRADLTQSLFEDQQHLPESDRLIDFDVYLASQGLWGGKWDRAYRRKPARMLSFVKWMHVQLGEDVSSSYKLLQLLAVEGNVHTLALLLRNCRVLELDIIGQPEFPLHQNLLCAFAYEAARDSTNMCNPESLGVAMVYIAEGRRAEVLDLASLSQAQTLMFASRDSLDPRAADHPWSCRWPALGMGAGAEAQLQRYQEGVMSFMQALHARLAEEPGEAGQLWTSLASGERTFVMRLEENLGSFRWAPKRSIVERVVQIFQEMAHFPPGSGHRLGNEAEVRAAPVSHNFTGEGRRLE